MSGEPNHIIDSALEREILRWLRGCVRSTSLATPLRFLNAAYEAQGGKALREDFRRVTLTDPALICLERKGQFVVLGIAPRWTREDLLDAIQVMAHAPIHSDVEDFLYGKD